MHLIDIGADRINELYRGSELYGTKLEPFVGGFKVVMRSDGGVNSIKRFYKDVDSSIMILQQPYSESSFTPHISLCRSFQSRSIGH